MPFTVKASLKSGSDFDMKMKKSAAENENKKLGERGEKEACRYLKKSGWKILERNFKNPFGEVDIIAERKGVIAFVEVKTRLSDIFGLPSEAVNADRKRRYVKAAEFYFTNRPVDCVLRFDIIEIFRGQINHMENAFTK